MRSWWELLPVALVALTAEFGARPAPPPLPEPAPSAAPASS
jgi:hypothetical protein